MSKNQPHMAINDGRSESFSDRLKILMGKETESHFAQKCKIPLSTLRKYLNGSTPGLNKAIHIARLTGVNIEWLATGEGAILRRESYEKENKKILALLQGDQGELSKQNDEFLTALKPRIEAYNELKSLLGNYSDVAKEVLATHLSSIPTQDGQAVFTQIVSEIRSHQLTDEFALVPGYRVQVSAGHGALNGENEPPCRYLAFRRKWLNHKGYDSKDLAIVWAKGDSMHPAISDNDTLVVHLGRKTPKDGYIYVFRNSEELFVKRYQRALGNWRLLSDNPIYPPLDIPKEDQHQFEVIGQVVHLAKDIAD